MACASSRGRGRGQNVTNNDDPLPAPNTIPAYIYETVPPDAILDEYKFIGRYKGSGYVAKSGGHVLSDTEYSNYMIDLNNFYKTTIDGDRYNIPAEIAHVGLLCVAFNDVDRTWYRAIITKTYSDQKTSLEVYLIDAEKYRVLQRVNCRLLCVEKNWDMPDFLKVKKQVDPPTRGYNTDMSWLQDFGCEDKIPQDALKQNGVLARYTFPPDDLIATEVFMSYETTPDDFYFCLNARERDYERLRNAMDAFYSQPENAEAYKIPYDWIDEDLVCVVFRDFPPSWHRVIVKYKVDARSVVVFFVDLGKDEKMLTKNLRLLTEKFAQPPIFAVPGKLFNVQPYDENGWTQQITWKFRQLLTGPKMAPITAVLIRPPDENGRYRCNLYNSELNVTNDELKWVRENLIASNLAKRDNSQ